MKRNITNIKAMTKKILWIVGGLVAVTLAFFIPDRSGSIWPAVISSSVVATIFLISFVFRWMPEVNSSLNKRAIIVAVAVFLVGSGVFATVSYTSSGQQFDRMVKIRTYIEKELLTAHIHKPLLKTLQLYQDSDNENPSLDALFHAKYDSVIQDDRFLIEGLHKEDPTAFFVQKAVNDTVILVGESRILDARSDDYQNVSGEEGRFEMRGILTPNGITYERRN